MHDERLESYDRSSAWHVGGVAARAATSAVADVWGRISNFVAQGDAPKGWGGVAGDHPFIGRTADNKLVLNRGE